MLDSSWPGGVLEIEMRFQLPLVALALAIPLTSGPARAAELTVRLSVKDAGFEPAELKVPPDARVRIEVTNDSASAIEFESFELNRERVVQPGQTAAVYVSGLAAGRYDFFDDFHQTRHGALVVE
jgi:plastocyanin